MILFYQNDINLFTSTDFELRINRADRSGHCSTITFNPSREAESVRSCQRVDDGENQYAACMIDCSLNKGGAIF